MSHEHQNQPSQPRPYEVFDFTEEELTRWRISDEKLKEILTNKKTTICKVKLSTNNYGEFVFLTASRGKRDNRIYMTFWGYGYHQYRERWIHKEWFWYQTPAQFVDPLAKIPLEEAEQILEERMADISPHVDEETQTETGFLFEILADMTDDDAALSEMQDLELL